MEVYMSDLSKIAGKFDLQKIIGDVKSMINPVVIPEANKDDPLAYCLSELGKVVKELTENHAKQADNIAKVNALLGTLHQEITTHCKGAAPAKPQEAAAPAAKPEKAAEPAKPEEKAAEPAEAPEPPEPDKA